jgi:hypothetical protein
MTNKKGAIELSMTTVVVIVLAMSMLILGLVLVRSIFTGATQNVVSINENVKAQIDKLFTEEDQITALYLSTGIAEVKQGEAYGVGFAIRNTNVGAGTATVGYNVVKDSQNSICTAAGINVADWISGGNTGSGEVAAGSRYYARVLFQPPTNAPISCIGTFHIGKACTGTAAAPCLDFSPIQFFIKIKAK